VIYQSYKYYNSTSYVPFITIRWQFLSPYGTAKKTAFYEVIKNFESHNCHNQWYRQS